MWACHRAVKCFHCWTYIIDKATLVPRQTRASLSSHRTSLCAWHTVVLSLWRTPESPEEVFTNAYAGFHPQIFKQTLSRSDVRSRHFKKQLQKRFWCAPEFDSHGSRELINNRIINEKKKGRERRLPAVSESSSWLTFYTQQYSIGWQVYKMPFQIFQFQGFMNVLLQSPWLWPLQREHRLSDCWLDWQNLFSYLFHD